MKYFKLPSYEGLQICVVFRDFYKIRITTVFPPHPFQFTINIALSPSSQSDITCIDIAVLNTRHTNPLCENYCGGVSFSAMLPSITPKRPSKRYNKLYIFVA